MLTFKPNAGSRVFYQSNIVSTLYLIEGYVETHPNIANIVDLDTGELSTIIVQFNKWGTSERAFNNLLTVTD